MFGWNDHADHHFRNSLFWHKVWVENGRPANGIYANLRHITRSEYHKERKFAMKNEDILQSQKMAESLINDTTADFWHNVKKYRPKKRCLPKTVDEAQDPKSISDLFKDKFDQLYNCISYNEVEMRSLEK